VATLHIYLFSKKGESTSDALPLPSGHVALYNCFGDSTIVVEKRGLSFYIESDITFEIVFFFFLSVFDLIF
jgi:hypothetical protein